MENHLNLPAEDGPGNETVRQGIYAIKHLPSGRLYIGSSSDIPRRWREHRAALRKGGHCNRKLQHSWTKHGESTFKLIVAQAVQDEADVLFWEQFWIDRLSPHYNLDRIVTGGSRGRKASDASRERMRAAQRGVAHDPSAMIRSNAARPDEWWARRGEKVAAATSGTFCFISPDGAVVQVVNLAKFCRENNLVENRMREIWRGTRIKKHHGWVSGRSCVGQL
jgi:predicted GIY-YIG superfamily endonuclease